MLKQIIVKIIIPVFDLLLSPLTMAGALYMKLIRRAGVYRMTISRSIFNYVGMFPIVDHYYEPLFNPVRLIKPLSEERALPGINWNIEGQLDLLVRFDYNDELLRLQKYKGSPLQYCYENINFRAGDAEYLYNMIRLHKPKQIIEIGSGFSTLMAHHAVNQNRVDQPDYQCRHICIEPYEMNWLEQLPSVEVVRQRVENAGTELFNSLGENDILFIDSSHVIRPQGDVLVEFLQILPALRAGVLVHVHDIFSPCDYPAQWLVNEVRLYNEQYLLEAFLSCNAQFEIIGALNYLKHHHLAAFAEKCPVFRQNPDAYEPGSFWIRKVTETR